MIQTISIHSVIEPYIREGCKTFSVCGSGGKTTLIRKAALWFGRRMRVAVAASTKMGLPDDDWRLDGEIPQIITAEDLRVLDYNCCMEVSPDLRDHGLIFYTDEILYGEKIHGFSGELFEVADRENDLILIESDGSARYPYKGWAEFEPVVRPETDVTVGILPMCFIGEEISDQLVHRLPLFLELTGKKEGQLLDADALIKVIMSPEGLFKASKGKKLLVLGRIQTEEQMQAAARIRACTESCVDKIVWGGEFE